MSCVSSSLRPISLDLLFQEVFIAIDPLRDSSKQRQRIQTMMHSPVINQNVRKVHLCDLGVREFSINNVLRAMTKGFLPKAAFRGPMDGFLAAFHCLRKLYALTVEGVSLEECEYMAILSAPTLKRLRIRNVSLKGPRCQPLVSTVTDLEVYWSQEMESLAIQLFLDLAPTLQYVLVDTSLELPLHFNLPEAHHIHTFHLISRAVQPTIFYSQTLSSFLLQSPNIVDLKFEIEGNLDYTPPASSLPSLNRLALLTHSMPRKWTSNRQLQRLELTHAEHSWSNPKEIARFAAAAISITQLRLTIEWLVAATTLHLVASSSTSFTSVFLIIRPREGFVETVEKFAHTAIEPWTAVGNLDITFEWNGDRSDLLELGMFRRWFKARVEDEYGKVRKARFDIWRRGYGISRRFDASKDDIWWWESWDCQSREWHRPRDWGLPGFQHGGG